MEEIFQLVHNINNQTLTFELCGNVITLRRFVRYHHEHVFRFTEPIDDNDAKRRFVLDGCGVEANGDDERVIYIYWDFTINRYYYIKADDLKEMGGAVNLFTKV